MIPLVFEKYRYNLNIFYLFRKKQLKGDIYIDIDIDIDIDIYLKVLMINF